MATPACSQNSAFSARNCLTLTANRLVLSVSSAPRKRSSRADSPECKVNSKIEAEERTKLEKASRAPSYFVPNVKTNGALNFVLPKNKLIEPLEDSSGKVTTTSPSGSIRKDKSLFL